MGYIRLHFLTLQSSIFVFKFDVSSFLARFLSFGLNARISTKKPGFTWFLLKNQRAVIKEEYVRTL